MENQIMSFQEWELKYFQEKSNGEPEIVIESIEETDELSQAAGESPATSPEEPEKEENLETLNQLTKLCRVCSSNGLISISSHISPKLFTMRPSGDMKQWQIPIAKIIAEVSGEKVNLIS